MELKPYSELESGPSSQPSQSQVASVETAAIGFWPELPHNRDDVAGMVEVGTQEAPAKADSWPNCLNLGRLYGLLYFDQPMAMPLMDCHYMGNRRNRLIFYVYNLYDFII